MLRYEQHYRMVDGKTPLGSIFFNPVFKDIDLRIHGLETLKMDWEAAMALVTEQGLKRIDTILLPAYQRVQDLADLGFLTAAATTPGGNVFTAGEQGVLIKEGPERDLFTPTPFVVLSRAATYADYAIAQVLSYDRATGLLEVNVLSAEGAEGPHEDVYVSAAAGSELAARSFLTACQTAKAAATGAAEQTALDRQATAQDRQATGQDRQVVSQAKSTAVTAAETATTKAAEAVAAALAVNAANLFTISGKATAAQYRANTAGAGALTAEAVWAAADWSSWSRPTRSRSICRPASTSI